MTAVVAVAAGLEQAGVYAQATPWADPGPGVADSWEWSLSSQDLEDLADDIGDRIDFAATHAGSEAQEWLADAAQAAAAGLARAADALDTAGPASGADAPPADLPDGFLPSVDLPPAELPPTPPLPVEPPLP